MDTPIQRTLDVSSKKMELLKLLLKKEGIATSQQSNAPSQPPLQPASRAQPLPLSFAQQRLWFLDQLDPGSVAYTIPMALRLLGPLDLPALQASLRALIQRHEVLRTTFDSVDGQPVQLIAAEPQFDFPMLDLSALPPEARLAQEQGWLLAAGQAPFDLARGPLLRVRLLRAGEQDHLLHISFHHIIFDGWSAPVFLGELATLYLAALTGTPAPLPPLPVQYADYALWQRAWLQGERLQEQLAYWQQQLRDAPPFLDLPTDYPRPALHSSHGHSLSFHLPAELQAGLERLGQQEGTTLFMTLLAAWQVLLSRHSGQEDVLVGSPIANRGRAEIAGLIGLFVNTLVLRTDLSGNPSFRDVLRRVREVALGAYSHQEVPFEQVVEAVRPPRDASRSPLFQVMFAMETASTTSMALPGLQVQQVEVEDEVAKFDLSLFVQPGSNGLTGVLEYNSDLFAEASMQRLLEHWRVLVQDIVAHPACPIGQLALLSDDERQQVLRAWNATGQDYDATRRIQEMFEAQVEQTPDALALSWEQEQVSYGHLNERANQLARQLQQGGVGAETPVGILLPRRPDLLISLLAVLKAGGAYLPLDPTYPAERVAFMLHDARAPLVLTQRAFAERVAGSSAQVWCVDEPEVASQALPASNLASAGSAEQLAYIMYTSGSTGQPKGVMITHQGLVNYLTWGLQTYGRSGGRGAPLHSSISFDLTVTSIFLPLLMGEKVVICREGVGVETLDQALRAEGNFNLVKVTPAHLEVLDHSLGNIELDGLTRVLILGGEALFADRLVRWHKQSPTTRLINEYGPTETVVGCCIYEVTAVEELSGMVPIGRPIANMQIYILDRWMQPVPVGVPGEIYIGGVGVARGYMNRADLTAARFVPDPFDETGGRLYRTGDLAKYRADGILEYLGRQDSQVKVRGYRIELGEIETALQRQPDVRECAVIVREDKSGYQQLVAYIVPGERHPQPGELRAVLQKSLPDYMVPAQFVMLDAFPLTLNGKVDRRALKAPDKGTTEANESYIAPRDSIELQLVSIWEELLETKPIGVTDNFFLRGGHSLLVLRLMAQIQSTFGCHLPLVTLFQAPIIADQAQLVRRSIQNDTEDTSQPPLQPASRAQPLPLSFAQQRLWFLDQLDPGSVAYTIPMALRLLGPLDLPALQASLRALIQRHEVLRTTFGSAEGQLVQQIAAAPALDFPVLDLSQLSPQARRAQEHAWLVAAGQTPFDLARGPLLRMRVVRCAEQDYLVHLSFHHIIFDGWSAQIFLRELTTLYLAALAGVAASLPTLPVQYADYALWQRAWLQGERLQEQLAYWQQQLRDAPPFLDLPTDYPRPSLQTFRGHSLTCTLPVALQAGLERLGQQEGTTLFMTLLATWQVLLSRHSGQEDVLVGSPIANRGRPEIEDVIGLFVNTLVLRTDLSGNPSFRDVLRRVREVALGAYSHQDIPFEQVVEAVQPPRDASRSPLFQVMFAMETATTTSMALPGLQVQPVEVADEVAKFDLSLFVQPGPTGVTSVLEYNSDLFAEATMQRLLEHWRVLVQDIVAHSACPIGHLALLSDDERQQVLRTWNTTGQDYDATRRIQEMFEAQVEQTPDAVALSWEQEQVSYGHLNERANQLARQLQQWGVGAETPVGILLPRRPDLLISLLAVLKAGGAYLPLDPTYPAERIAFMLHDAQASLVFTQRALADRLGESGAQVYCVDEPEAGCQALPASNLASAGSAEQLAYIMYTSGSTGQPKGVMIAHRNTVALLQWAREHFSAQEMAGTLASSSVCLDVSVFELFAPLCAGGAVIMAEDVLQLPSTVNAAQATMLCTVPSIITELVRSGQLPATIQSVNFAGEELSQKLVQQIYEHGPAGRVRNFYGSTENTTFSAYALLERDATAPPSFGQPLPGGEVYLLDRALQPVPIGVVGEIFLGGAGLARGYWQRPDLTAERFIPHPFSNHPGTRLYRTGDMGRRLVDGTLVLANGNTLPAPKDAPTEDMGKYISPRDSIELQLVSIWEELLERTQISITDNFFEIGGHSLLAVMLINQVKGVFKQSIPLADLFRNATIQSFADLLRKPEQRLDEVSSALVSIQPQGTKTPLFFIHPVGGEVLCYMELASLLSADHPFYGLRFPFKEEAAQTPIRMEELVANYTGALRTVQPQGPYILGGWSLGGTIAYAMAQQLRIQGEEVPALVFIDSYAPATFTEESDDIHLLLEMVADLGYNMGNALPDIVNQPGFRESIFRRLGQLSPRERLRYIWEQGREIRIIPATLTLSQMQQMFFTFKANIMAVRNYVPVLADQRIILFKPDEGTDAVDDRANGWNSLSERPLEIYTLPGNHYTLLKRPYVKILAEQLKEFLRRNKW